MKKLKTRSITRTVTVTEVSVTLYHTVDKVVTENTLDVVGYTTREEIDCYLRNAYDVARNYKLIDFTVTKVKTVKATMSEDYFYQQSFREIVSEDVVEA